MHQPDTSKLPDLINGIVAVRHLHYRVITETGLTTADKMLYSANYPLVRRFGILSCHRSSLRRRPRTPFRCFWNRYAYRHEKPDFRQFDCRSMVSMLHKINKILSTEDAEVDTDGNPLAHAILRGANTEKGGYEPNYYYDILLKTIKQYEQFGLENPFIVIDTNHDNSGKNYLEQIRIVRQTLINRDWNESIRKYVRGFMIESYLEDGRQDSPEVYGKSITDPCLGWEKTEALIREIHQTL